MIQTHERLIKMWLLPTLVIFGGIMAILGLVTALDLALVQPNWPFLDLFLRPDRSAANMPATVAPSLSVILGISISVVVLAVQLAANKYSYKIIDLFISDPVNVAMLLLFAGSTAYGFWQSVLIKVDFVPPINVTLTVALGTFCFVAIIPYFHYLFRFLEPTNIIARIQSQASKLIMTAGSKEQYSPKIQNEVIQRLDQIADIATTSAQQMDSGVALSSVRALESLICDYIAIKGQTEKNWFEVSFAHFHGLSSPAIAQIVESHTWLEMKGFMLLNIIFGVAINREREVANAIAIASRNIGQAALKAGDELVVDLTIKFFNTLLRAAINGQDRLTSYNIPYQYRLFAETLLPVQPDSALKITQHLRYYASVAEDAGVGFISGAIAHDLNVLCQKALEGKRDIAPATVECFLGLADDLERAGHIKAVRQVYKMYASLAGFLGVCGEQELLAKVKSRLRKLTREELRTVVNQLMATSEPIFWELTDRMINFDYLDDEQKQALARIFDELLADESMVASGAPTVRRTPS